MTDLYREAIQAEVDLAPDPDDFKTFKGFTEEYLSWLMRLNRLVSTVTEPPSCVPMEELVKLRDEMFTRAVGDINEPSTPVERAWGSATQQLNDLITQAVPCGDERLRVLLAEHHAVEEFLNPSDRSRDQEAVLAITHREARTALSQQHTEE